MTVFKGEGSWNGLEYGDEWGLGKEKEVEEKIKELNFLEVIA